MADNVPITAGSGTSISTEEVTTLNGGSVSAQHIQRMLLAYRTADGQVRDVPARPYGPLRVSGEDRTLFYDPFDGGSVDTTNRWVTGTGTNAPSQANSTLTFGTTTTVSIYGKLPSQPSFNAIIPGFCQISFALALNTASSTERTNGHRFWGLGTSPSTPATTSASTKLTDAVGFEVDTDGKMYACVYTAGVRTAVDLSSSGTGSATSAQPLDGAQHRYIIQYRTDAIYWFIDSLLWPVASMNFTLPSVQTLPVLLQTINPGASVAAGGYPLVVQGAVVADTAGNSTQISDGTYAWRKAQVDSSGRLQTTIGSALPAGTANIGSVTALNAKAAVTTGSISTSTGTAAVDVTNYQGLTLAVSGTHAGFSFAVDGSDDGGATYPYTLQFYDVPNFNSLLSTSPATNSTNLYRLDVSGMTNVQVRATARTSGTLALRFSPTADIPSLPPATTQRNALWASGDRAIKVRLTEDSVGNALGQTTSAALVTAPAALRTGIYAFSSAELTLGTATGVKELLTIFKTSGVAEEVQLLYLQWTARIVATAGTLEFQFQHITAENGTPGGASITPEPLNRGNSFPANINIRSQVTGAPTTTGQVFGRNSQALPAAATPDEQSNALILWDSRVMGAQIYRGANAEGIRLTYDVKATITTAPIGTISGIVAAA